MKDSVPPDAEAKNIMLTHGLINAALVGGAGAMACWRRSHAPTVTSGCIGLLASSVALYSAYLGGKMVYGKGMGAREKTSPPVLSKQAPWQLLKDAASGMRWLATSAAARVVGGTRRLTT